MTLNDISKAIDILKSGGIVIFPTDTAYGIGCRMDDAKAVERLIKIRKRPAGKAFPVLVDSIEMAQFYLQPIPEKVIQELMKKYWPGALTIVLNCKIDKVPSLVRGGGGTLGVRMPNLQALLEVIKGIGVPLIGTSANFAGEKTPFNYEEIDKELIKSVDYMLKSKQVHTGTNLASAVIDCTSEPWKVLRHGNISSLLNFDQK